MESGYIMFHYSNKFQIYIPCFHVLFTLWYTNIAIENGHLSKEV